MKTKILAASITAVVLAGAGTAFAAASTGSSAASDYVPLASTRILDTRTAGGAVGAGKTLVVSLGSSVPATATAVTVELTATSSTTIGYLQAYADGTTRPAQGSNVNYGAGETIGNLATVPVTDGKIDVYNASAGTAQVVVDLEGYYTPSAPAYVAPQTTFSASTVVSAWPESSGWATDNFNRTATLTRGASVPAPDCGSSASACWFYTEVLTDNGSFTAVAGKPAPNGSDSKTISSAVTGTMVGGGKLEFYADSSTPNPSLVPVTADGTSGLSTTNWYRLFFAAGTNFGTAPEQVAGYGPWTTYAWNYASSCQTWHDGINPGDDGQGAADGNITGTCAS